MEARPMRYWIIETDSMDGNMKEVRGPFETRAAAEACIRRDFEAVWNMCDIPLDDRDDDWSGTWLILQELSEVRPVGRNKLTVNLQIKKEASK
jgi:hypothetical protein